MLDDAGLDAIEARANAQAAGYARMSELDGGIGVLGVRHPEMYEDMLTWQRSTENEHADTVLALLRDLRAARQQFALPVQDADAEPTADEWREVIHAERARQIEKGHTPEHDRAAGFNHLIDWAIDYARRGKTVAVGGMLLSLREQLAVQDADTESVCANCGVPIVRYSATANGADLREKIETAVHAELVKAGMDLDGPPWSYGGGDRWPLARELGSKLTTAVLAVLHPAQDEADPQPQVVEPVDGEL